MEEAKQDSLETFVATQTAPEEGWQEFKNGRDQPQPICYKCDGSFKSLVEQNKMPATDANDIAGDAARQNRQTEKHYIPGSTHFYRGKQHVAGATYGNSTRRAFTTPYAVQVESSTLPEDPQENRLVEHKLQKGSFVTTHFGNKPYQVPGYTGHISGTRDVYGQTYGSMTNDQMVQWKKDNPTWGKPEQREGYAKTTKAAHIYTVNSNPLPGGITRNVPPVKLVPSTLNTLQYY